MPNSIPNLLPKQKTCHAVILRIKIKHKFKLVNPFIVLDFKNLFMLLLEEIISTSAATYINDFKISTTLSDMEALNYLLKIFFF